EHKGRHDRDDRADFGDERHDDQNDAGDGDDEAAADSGQRNGADVLIVGNQRDTAEQNRNRRSEAVGGHGAAHTALGAFDAEHFAQREGDAHGVDRRDQMVDDDDDQAGGIRPGEPA